MTFIVPDVNHATAFERLFFKQSRRGKNVDSYKGYILGVHGFNRTMAIVL